MDFIEHYGIKGQRWGVRRYQNEDGSLTPAGKKRYSKEYEKLSEKVTSDLQKKSNDMYIESYNRAANSMNSGGIDKFNASQRKKYGEKYAEREGYDEDFNKFFDKEFTKNFNKSLDEFYKTNPNVKKARELVDKYNMTSWNELAKNNEAAIEEVRRAVEKSLK